MDKSTKNDIITATHKTQQNIRCTYLLGDVSTPMLYSKCLARGLQGFLERSRGGISLKRYFCDISSFAPHYDDVIMTTIASQITSLTIVYSTVYSDADQRKHQSPASLGFVWGIHRGPVNSPHKGSVTRKMFPFDDVIMNFLNWCFFVWNRLRI